jgi:hypothetical protein
MSTQRFTKHYNTRSFETKLPVAKLVMAVKLVSNCTDTFSCSPLLPPAVDVYRKAFSRMDSEEQNTTAHTDTHQAWPVCSCNVITLWWRSYDGFGVAAVEFSPSSLKERAHAMTSLPHRRIVFIKRLTIIEYQTHVRTEFIPWLVSATDRHNGSVTNRPGRKS